MKTGKTSMVLPNYDARKEINAPGRTIVDYAKATPYAIGRENPDPNLINNLRLPRVRP